VVWCFIDVSFEGLMIGGDDGHSDSLGPSGPLVA
jgi:hypothetical protein